MDLLWNSGGSPVDLLWASGGPAVHLCGPLVDLGGPSGTMLDLWWVACGSLVDLLWAAFQKRSSKCLRCKSATVSHFQDLWWTSCDSGGSPGDLLWASGGPAVHFCGPPVDLGGSSGDNAGPLVGRLWVSGGSPLGRLPKTLFEVFAMQKCDSITL